METITLWDGRSVPRIGVGCWAIGGRTFDGEVNTAYGDVDDDVALAGLRLADEMGARFFDTAAYYGGGHSEQLLGRAFAGREDIVIASKFGVPVDPVTRRSGALDLSENAIRASVERSRTNLKRDRIDLLLFHLNGYPVEASRPVFDVFAALRAEGKIGAFGWSNDRLEGVRELADREGFVAVENDYNVFQPATALMAFAEQRGLVSISRLPLAMGLLTGKYSSGLAVSASDVRAEPLTWLKFFKDGRGNPEFLEHLERIRGVLTAGGRSLAQGALGWILAKSPVALPVPGFKTPAQVRDNLGALALGALSPEAMAKISEAIGFSS